MDWRESRFTRHHNLLTGAVPITGPIIQEGGGRTAGKKVGRKVAGGISYVGGLTGFHTAATASFSIASIPVAENDYAVLVVSRATSGAMPALAGWTTVYAANGSDPTAGIPYAIYIATRRMTAGESSISFPTGFSNTSYGIQVFRGVNLTTPLDVATQVQTFVNDTAQPNPPAITPVTSGAVVVACGGSHGSFDANDFTSSDLTNFLTQQNETASFDPLVGMGFIPWSGSGPVDPAQFGGGTTGNVLQCSAASATIALRPA